ncbi:MAG: hypothetical protein GY765_14425 [bacterium]|nr:hypothetical protein [bacterium]
MLVVLVVMLFLFMFLENSPINLSNFHEISLGVAVLYYIGKFIHTKILASKERKIFFAELSSFNPDNCSRVEIYRLFEEIEWEDNRFKFVDWLTVTIKKNPSGQWPPKSFLVGTVGGCPGEMLERLDYKWRHMPASQR